MVSSQQKKAGLILVAVGWFLVFVLTLYPTPEDAVIAAVTSMWCLVCGETGLADVALNVILFVPLGIGLGLLQAIERLSLKRCAHLDRPEYYCHNFVPRREA